MSDFIGHECGLALIRLRRPLSYYRDTHDDPAWGLRRLYLLMEKQHNRGQDGAGFAVVKSDMPSGESFLRRTRSSKRNALERIFDQVFDDFTPKRIRSRHDASDLTLKRSFSYLGEVCLGHLRYATHSSHSQNNCHPFIRRNSVASQNLAVAGNFNLTNSGEVFQQLIDYGLDLVGESDTQVVLERIGYELDREHDYLVSTMGPESFRGLSGRELAAAVSQELDLQRVLRKASAGWDGGYAMAGLVGNGDAFVYRDPAGIRPCHFYMDDDVVAVASERVALSSVFNVEADQVEPVKPGHALIVKRDGAVSHVPVDEPREERQCTFERIYFSRGNDPDIYRQRKDLGRQLAPRILDAIDDDLPNTVFSFVPNTAETAYLGLVEEVARCSRERQFSDLWKRIEAGEASPDDLRSINNQRIRAEKIAHKDQRLRTFITHDDARKNLVMHIYDVTRGVVKDTDTLVVLDDSIVRGTTLRESIITILSRLNPKRIIIASSAPPIMYPDCYGIDMSQLGRFIAFEAAVDLACERGQESLLEEIEQACRSQMHLPAAKHVNHVARLYELFTLHELSARIAKLVRPRDIEWSGQVDVIYQSIEGLQASMPAYTGDWYFTGHYPTPGGYKVLTRSFINYREQVDTRAYETPQRTAPAHMPSPGG